MKVIEAGRKTKMEMITDKFRLIVKIRREHEIKNGS